MEPDLFPCEACRKMFPFPRMTLIEGGYFCPNCLEAETLFCHCCGKRIWRDDAFGDSSTPLCEYCEEYHYGHCADCGRLVQVDDLWYLSDEFPSYCKTCYIKHI